MQPTRLPRKKDVVLQLLEQATVYVHLDPRGETVSVPPWFKRQPQLVLQIGLNMAVPIPDLEVDDNGLSCTLSFNRSPFLCVIPWSAVFALVDENRQGMVWPDDVPPELAQQAAQQAKAQPARADLKVAPAPAAEAEAKKESAPKRRARKTKAKPRVVAAAAAAPAKPARATAASKRAAAPAKQRATVKRAAPAAEKAAVPKAQPAVAPAPAPAAAAGGAGKRKLPPYLRIVK